MNHVPSAAVFMSNGNLENIIRFKEDHGMIKYDLKADKGIEL